MCTSSTAFVKVVLDQRIVWTSHVKAGSVLRVSELRMWQMWTVREEGHWVRSIWMKVTDEMESLHLKITSPESWSWGEKAFLLILTLLLGHELKNEDVNSSIPGAGAWSLCILSVISIFFMSINGSVVVLLKAFDDRLQDTAWGYKTNNSRLLHGCYLTCKNEYLPACASAGLLDTGKLFAVFAAAELACVLVRAADRSIKGTTTSPRRYSKAWGKWQ